MKCISFSYIVDLKIVFFVFPNKCTNRQHDGTTPYVSTPDLSTPPIQLQDFSTPRPYNSKTLQLLDFTTQDFTTPSILTPRLYNPKTLQPQDFSTPRLYNPRCYNPICKNTQDWIMYEKKLVFSWSDPKLYSLSWKWLGEPLIRYTGNVRLVGLRLGLFYFVRLSLLSFGP